MNKVLIVTYYWPPSGGISVQRIVKFCKYMPAFGWEPIILTVDYGSYSQIDRSYLKDIEQIQNVHRAISLEPHWIYNKIRPKQRKSSGKSTKKSSAGRLTRVIDWVADFIRLNIFIPDARIGWYPGALREGLKIIAQEKPALIFSTAPPFTSHLIAKKLHQKSGLPWVADFRDAWLENNLYHKSYRLAAARLSNKLLERSVLNQADTVVCIGKNMMKLLTSKVEPNHLSKFHVISNGYDVDDVQPSVSTSNPDLFYISYFGTVYKERLPKAFLSELRKSIEKDTAFKTKVRFRVFGNVDHAGLDILRKYIPEDNLIINKPIAYDNFMKELQVPQLLLLTIDDVPFNELIITGKIFDYMTSGNPIIGIGPSDGDAAMILKQTQAGKMFGYNDEHIVDHILEKYQQWQRSELKLNIDSLHQFERKQLTKKLTELFNETKKL